MRDNIPRRVLENNIEIYKRKMRSYFEMHSHDYFEIELITSGEGIQLLNGTEYELKKGCVSLLTTTDFHEIIHADNVETYNISFTESCISEHLTDRIMNTGTNIVCKASDTELDNMVHLAELLRTDDGCNGEYSKNLLDCLVMLILKNTATGDKSAACTSDLLVHKAITYMRIHFRENMSLADLAEYVNLNKSYFCKIFCKETGVSPMSYLSKLRLNYAKKLLFSTKLTVTEICFTSGFTSLSNFLKSFKREFGASPTQMRGKV